MYKTLSLLGYFITYDEIGIYLFKIPVYIKI